MTAEQGKTPRTDAHESPNANLSAKELAKRLGDQYAPRQMAALRDDKQAWETANFWLHRIADGNWHTIIKALRAYEPEEDAETPVKSLLRKPL